MTELAAIFEIDVERAKKEFLAALQRNETSNHEIAEWCTIFSDKYNWTNTEIGRLAGKSEFWVRAFRKWRATGFNGSPFDRGNHPDNSRPGHHSIARSENSLESQENFEDDDFTSDENIEEPGKVLDNILDSIKQSRAVAEAYRKILKVSPFDRQAKKEISDAIESLIRKWRSVQSTLVAKGKADVEQTS